MIGYLRDHRCARKGRGSGHPRRVGDGVRVDRAGVGHDNEAGDAGEHNAGDRNEVDHNKVGDNDHDEEEAAVGDHGADRRDGVADDGHKRAADSDHGKIGDRHQRNEHRKKNGEPDESHWRRNGGVGVCSGMNGGRAPDWRMREETAPEPPSRCGRPRGWP